MIGCKCHQCRTGGHLVHKHGKRNHRFASLRVYHDGKYGTSEDLEVWSIGSGSGFKAKHERVVNSREEAWAWVVHGTVAGF